jgi:hypothetical protein
MPQGVSRPEATVSSRKACRSVEWTASSPARGAAAASTFARSASSRISTTSERIFRSSSVAANGGISVPGRPSRMLAASSASPPPKRHSSSSRLEARPPSSCSPWQLAHSSPASRAASPSPTP